MDRPPYAHDKRYYTLYEAMTRRFGRRVMKASVDAGFTCPNLDGTCGTRGCAFCRDGSSGCGGLYGSARPSITGQLALERRRIREKWPDAGLIAYFQAHTNTYAPVDTLKSLYEEALEQEGVCGLSIATRPDALPEPVADYLADLSRRTYLTVELGLQTIHDDTARRFGRGYDTACFIDAVTRLRTRGIRVCAHLIDGLPGETRDRMLESARTLADLRVDGVKIHLLHILSGTRLAEEYEAGNIEPLSREAYIDTVVRQLELLPPDTVVERLTGDGIKSQLLAPLWSLDKIAVLGGIDKELARRDTWQGKAYEVPPHKI